METTTIYIATHKFFIPPFYLEYKPIVAGANRHHLPFLKDNTGENISDKNPYYSELTALYWIWKYDKSKYVGLVHYHRYFFDDHLLRKSKIDSLLDTYDMIVPTPTYLEKNVLEQYASIHYKNDLELAVEEILKRNIAFKPFIDQVLSANHLYTCNMFITKKEILDEYAAFLFSILFSLEEKIPYLTYSLYNRRVFGFLAERIFNIYIKKKGYYLYECPVLETLSETLQEKKRIRILKDEFTNTGKRKKI